MTCVGSHRDACARCRDDSNHVGTYVLSDVTFCHRNYYSDIFGVHVWRDIERRSCYSHPRRNILYFLLFVSSALFVPLIHVIRAPYIIDAIFVTHLSFVICRVICCSRTRARLSNCTWVMKILALLNFPCAHVPSVTALRMRSVARTIHFVQPPQVFRGSSEFIRSRFWFGVRTSDDKEQKTAILRGVRMKKTTVYKLAKVENLLPTRKHATVSKCDSSQWSVRCHEPFLGKSLPTQIPTRVIISMNWYWYQIDITHNFWTT